MESRSEPKDIESPGRGNNAIEPGADDSGSSFLEGEKEKHLIRKIDMHILPLVVLLYLFSFLDRGSFPIPSLRYFFLPAV
jgi:hypothetical protein